MKELTEEQKKIKTIWKYLCMSEDLYHKGYRKTASKCLESAERIIYELEGD